MRPLVESGARITLAPVEFDGLQTGDIVLCRVKGNVFLRGSRDPSPSSLPWWEATAPGTGDCARIESG
jgi:hypothetical protein